MRRVMRRIPFWVAIAVILFVFVFPLLYILVTSFKPVADILVPTRLLFTPTLENFRVEFTQFPFVEGLRNTVIVSVASTALVMAVAIPAAYSFARFNTGSGHLLFVTISTRMFPGVVAAIPFFFAFRDVGLLDTHFGLSLLYLYFNMSFATFLLFGFFREIPEELEQAAMVDGYGRFEIFRRIIFPLIGPGVAITTVFCLVFAWNEFFFGYIFTRTAARTISYGLITHWGSEVIQWGPMAAGVFLGILPTLVAAWFMQRYIIRGLTFGAVKG